MLFHFSPVRLSSLLLPSPFPRPPRSPPFPYTTLFRSARAHHGVREPVSLDELFVGGGYRAGLERAGRSEEHTSELQSRGHLVCRLLLEKKKKCEPPSLTSREATVHIPM